MSTMRRRLGTGPSTIKSTPSGDSAPRLLPAERWLEQRLDDDEHQVLPDAKGRRALGPGTAH
ncbi:hypothetical protein ACGFZC_33705 [[Kitasatospora] papulosa]|uniref:hypothetical protein n=1 Tax=Streptomyces TaxID=1883 RepID=UPI002E28FC05|nr:hypothetical protein [[Kitasatospora] papulosa]